MSEARIASESLGPTAGFRDPDRCAGLLGAIRRLPGRACLTTSATAVLPAYRATRRTEIGFRTTLDIQYLRRLNVRAVRNTSAIEITRSRNIFHHLHPPKVSPAGKVEGPEIICRPNYDNSGYISLVGDEHLVRVHQQQRPIP